MKTRKNRLFRQITGARREGGGPLLRRVLKQGVVRPATAAISAVPASSVPTHVTRSTHAPPAPTGRPLDALRDLVADEYRGSPKATREKFRQAFQELKAVGVRTTADLTPETLDRWADAWREKRSYGASHSVLRTIRRICSLAKDAEPEPFLTEESDPFRRRKLTKILRGYRKNRPTDRHLSIDQMRALLQRADAEALAGGWPQRRLRALVYLLAYTGCRKLEALGMRVEDVDFAEGILWIWPHAERDLKTEGSAAPLGLHPALRAVLDEWTTESGSPFLFPNVTNRAKPWRHGGPGFRPLDQLAALGVRAGVPGVTFLGFRQTLASLAEAWGWEVPAIQRQLRHASPQTQQHYRRADKRTVKDLAASIDYDLDTESGAPTPEPPFRPRLFGGTQ